MEDDTTAIAALERVLLTVEAELMALHSGEPVNAQALEARLVTDVTTPARASFFSTLLAVGSGICVCRARSRAA